MLDSSSVSISLSFSRCYYVLLEMQEGFSDSRFDRVSVPLYLAKKHRTLDSCNTKIGQPFFVGICRQFFLCLFPNEERSQFVFNDFKNQANILTNQLIIFGNL